MSENFIDIYTHSGKESVFNIAPATVKRTWMDETEGWAYNCLPLKIANQYGWVAHAPCSFSATWDGGPHKSSLVVTSPDFCTSTCTWVNSHFAHGILTINTDFLIKTTPGTSLYVRGMTNHQKDIIYPLDAVIETDWLPFHFPFSFKLIKPGTITFEAGDPLFMFFPVERDYIDTFEVTFKSLDSNPEFKEQNEKYSKSRQEHMNKGNPLAQKFYTKGTVVDEKPTVDAHKIKMRLHEPKVG